MQDNLYTRNMSYTNQIHKRLNCEDVIQCKFTAYQAHDHEEQGKDKNKACFPLERIKKS